MYRRGSRCSGTICCRLITRFTTLYTFPPLYTQKPAARRVFVFYTGFLWLCQASPLGRAFPTVSYTPKAPIRHLPDGGLWLFILEKGANSLIILRCGSLYGDNVFEKDGIRRDRTGDGEKTRCLCGKRGIFNRDGPAMGPQIIRQLERGASRRSASFFHALASPGRPRNGGGASGAYQPAEGRKALIQGRFRAQEGPLGPSRKSQQQTKRTGFAALEDSIADEAPEGKRAKRANRALNRAGINSRGQKQGFGGADRRAGRVTSR